MKYSDFEKITEFFLLKVKSDGTFDKMEDKAYWSIDPDECLNFSESPKILLSEYNDTIKYFENGEINQYSEDFMLEKYLELVNILYIELTHNPTKK